MNGIKDNINILLENLLTPKKFKTKYNINIDIILPFNNIIVCIILAAKSYLK